MRCSWITCSLRGATIDVGVHIQPGSVAVGHYVGILAARNDALRNALNDVLRGAMRDGSLERILRKWNVWNGDQERLYRRLLSGEAVPAVSGAADAPAPATTWEQARRYLPSLLRASLVTLLLSCLAMGLAVALGILIATGRVYGSPLIRMALTGYVELIRGTPVLLQLFVLYYGLAAAVRLPAFAAALLGLGLNYAAYESEIYRAALEAVSIGQLEAARILGLSERQILTARSRSPGNPAGSRRDDERLRRFAEGLLAGVGAHGSRAHQTNSDLRHQPRELGRARCTLRRVVHDHVAATCRSGAPPRAEVEGCHHMKPAALNLADVYLQRGTRRILSGITFQVAHGELVAVMGPSGSGKTTILRTIAALEPFQSGRIDVDDMALQGGAAPDSARLRTLRQKVGFVFQFHCLFEHLSALDNVALAPVRVHGVPRAEAERRAHELLHAFGVDHRAHALPRELSGGEAQRVAIARALAVDPPLLLMDEPTASLDPARRGELGDLLKRLVARGRTLVVATHDEDFAHVCATRVIRIADGVSVTDRTR